MNIRSFSDDAPAPLSSNRGQRLRAHALTTVVILSVLTLALGMHFAATALVVVGVGHLFLVGLVAGVAWMRRRWTRVAS